MKASCTALFKIEFIVQRLSSRNMLVSSIIENRNFWSIHYLFRSIHHCALFNSFFLLLFTIFVDMPTRMEKKDLSGWWLTIRSCCPRFLKNPPRLKHRRCSALKCIRIQRPSTLNEDIRSSYYVYKREIQWLFPNYLVNDVDGKSLWYTIYLKIKVK